MSKYYCLISGLPELNIDESKLAYTIESFKNDIYPDLSVADKKLIDLFYLKFDNANFLKLLSDSDAVLDERGHYVAEDFLQLIDAVRNEEKTETKLPPYFKDFLVEYLEAQGSDKGLSAHRLEDRISAYYYEYAMKCKNKFVSSWFELNLNINNILVAYTARKFKLEVAQNIVGETPVCKALKTSTARDFGLSYDLDYVDDLARISEISDLVDREKKVDMLKWEWLEDKSFFEYFTIERVFVFLMQTDILQRWLNLDKEAGNRTFREVIEKLKGEVQIPEEFRK